MLAFMGEQERERQISMIDFVRFNERTICCAESYRKELELVRQQGYALDKEEEASGIICIGAPVFDYRGHPTAAIWVTGPEFRFPVKKISKAGQVVAEYAEKLSIRLGYHK
jgi:DNA-binding IclR family transcriptional regulator